MFSSSCFASFKILRLSIILKGVNPIFCDQTTQWSCSIVHAWPITLFILNFTISQEEKFRMQSYAYGDVISLVKFSKIGFKINFDFWEWHNFDFYSLFQWMLVPMVDCRLNRIINSATCSYLNVVVRISFRGLNQICRICNLCHY